jgi:hypothetical protein
MWIIFLLFLLLLPLPLSVHAEDLGELSANPDGLSGSFSFFGLFGSFGFFGFPISQPNERDKLNKPNKRNEPVWSLPTAAALGATERTDLPGFGGVHCETSAGSGAPRHSPAADAGTPAQAERSVSASGDRGSADYGGLLTVRVLAARDCRAPGGVHEVTVSRRLRQAEQGAV